ncbi:MAG: hypothetical protein PHC61_04475 [Chitinivibrionales bacterium]|nr:hypothetical protein [Chitinivibrionales bacterium]
MITQKTMVESIQHVMSLDIRGKEKLADEIFVTQPNLLGTVVVLAKLKVPMAKMDEVFFILFVLYEAFQKRSGVDIPLVTEDMIEDAHKNYIAMLKYIDKEGMDEGGNLIGKAMAKSPNRYISAFVIGHLKDHGFSAYSEENEYCSRAAKVIMDCFIEAASLSAK